MKRMMRIWCVISAGISLLATSSALADGGFGGGHGGGGYHGGGYYGGYRGGWGGPVLSFSFGGPCYYADYPATYYYAPAPVVYSTPPVVVYSQPQVVYAQPAGPNTPVASPTPAPVQPNPQRSSMTVADIKALTKAGLSDEVILSQIRSQHAVFNLSTEEIIDLNTSKTSPKVIDFMLNTGRPRSN